MSGRDMSVNSRNSILAKLNANILELASPDKAEMKRKRYEQATTNINGILRTYFKKEVDQKMIPILQDNLSYEQVLKLNTNERVKYVEHVKEHYLDVQDKLKR